MLRDASALLTTSVGTSRQWPDDLSNAAASFWRLTILAPKPGGDIQRRQFNRYVSLTDERG